MRRALFSAEDAAAQALTLPQCCDSPARRFDPGWVVINMALWGGALLKFGGVF